MITHQIFIQRLLEHFPELESELNDSHNKTLIHVQTICFAQLTQKAIDAGDKARVDACFKFANEIFREADPEVSNAISVSYLEHLNFNDGRTKRAWAKSRMPSLLKAGYEDIMKYLNDLHEKKSKRSQ